MITGLGSIAVLASDAAKSAEWYRDKLGFEIVSNEGHAVFVRPKGGDAPLIHLCGRCEDWGNDEPGGRTGIWFASGEIVFRTDVAPGKVIPACKPEDVEKTYLELKHSGVQFSKELEVSQFGKMAILRDPDGHEFEIS